VRLLRALRSRLGRRNDRGHTLVEMMVATALLGVIMGSAYSAVAVMQHQDIVTSDRNSGNIEAQIIADRITKDIRTAISPSPTVPPFASADVQDVTFYAGLSDQAVAGPTKLHAYVSLVPGTNVYVFHEDATKPDAGGAPGNWTYSGQPLNRIDGRYLDISQPIFTYYDANGNQIPTPIPAAATTQLGSIDAVGISLRVRIRPGSPTVVINTKIHIRNVDYNPNS